MVIDFCLQRESAGEGGDLDDAAEVLIVMLPKPKTRLLPDRTARLEAAPLEQYSVG